MPDARDAESAAQRLTRNVNELLSELRVAQAGVQILFGFLLAVAFTTPFRESNAFEKGAYLLAVVLTVASIGLLVAPAAWHRVLFREGRRDDILRAGNRAALAGLVCLAAAMTVTVGLIGHIVFGVVAMAVLAVATGGGFWLLWYLTPKRLRHGDHEKTPDDDLPSTKDSEEP